MVKLLTNLGSGVKAVEGAAEANLERGIGEFIVGLAEFKKPSRCLGKHLRAVGNVG